MTKNLSDVIVFMPHAASRDNAMKLLARNARTSPEMIDRFYAAPLQGEINVGALQSKRRPRPWEYQ
jgi:hypothetical protein